MNMKTINYIFSALIILVSIVNNYSQWQIDVRLTNDPGASYGSEDRGIAVNGNNLHVIWQDHRDGDAEIYYKRSTNRGVTWSADTRISSLPDYSGAPSIAVYQSIVHVFWMDSRNANTDIYYRRSTDNGLTWEAEVRLTTNPEYSYNPSVAVSGANVFLFWSDNTPVDYEIYFKRSTNSGVNWSSSTRLTVDAFSSNFVSASSSGLNVHCTWQDNRNGNNEIYYKNSNDGGVSWSTDMRLTNDPASSTWPAISVSGLNVNVLWSDQRDGNSEIYFKRSTNGGSIWSSENRLTNAANNSINPCPVSFGPLIAFTWSDMRTGYYKIMYKTSTDGGLSWSTDLLLGPSGNTGAAVGGSIDVTDSATYVIWQDNKEGNNEIYFKRNIYSFPVGITPVNSEIPEEFSLSQNYPNPFNPATDIKFSIPKKGFTKLTVYDAVGRTRAVLYNGVLSAGTYNYDFDASQLASGIYFYKLESNEFSQTRKMVLIK
jgi:hypothetical protein